MATEQAAVRSIDGKGKTIKEILFARKFYIDYYQREYKWQTKQVEELINDLVGVFLHEYSAGHDRDQVANYDHYFLGSVIVSRKGGKDYIIDGQQRLTTLSLLIMWLLHRLKELGEDPADLAQLVYSKKHGKTAAKIADVLKKRLYEQPESLDGFSTLYLNQWSHKAIKRMLARFLQIYAPQHRESNG
jgi:hypothetical protein